MLIILHNMDKIFQNYESFHICGVQFVMLPEEF